MLKTTMYDQSCSKIIFVILTKNISIYALHTYLSHTALIARDSVKGKYNSSI